jgi:hypothetical protein
MVGIMKETLENLGKAIKDMERENRELKERLKKINERILHYFPMNITYVDEIQAIDIIAGQQPPEGS